MVAIVCWSTLCAADPLYVSCEDEGKIAVVDTHREERTALWEVGKRPRGLRWSGDRLFVAVSGSPKAGPGVDEKLLPAADRTADGIAELDRFGKRLRLIASGQDPETFDLTRDRLFVSNEETAQASIVDLKSGRVQKAVAIGGEPEGVGLSPDGKVVYVTSEADGAVFAIDTRSGAVLKRMNVPPRPRVVVFSSDGERAYVSSENGGTVTILDARRHAVTKTIRIAGEPAPGAMPARPMGLALSRDGKTLYVANGRGGSVSVIDTAEGRIVKTIAGVGARPWGIALSIDERKLFTANGPSNDVSVIDLASGAVKKIPVCKGPWGLALGN